MSRFQVLVNCIEADMAQGELLVRKLAEDGIDAQVLPTTENLDSLVQIVRSLEEVIGAGGVLVSFLSENALKDGLFISNIQYACEIAASRKVLVLYRTGRVEMENPAALYYPQAVTVRAVRNETVSFERLRTQVKRLLGIEKKRAFIPERLKSRTVRRTAAGFVLLSMMAGAAAAMLPEARVYFSRRAPVIATPVVFSQPFSKESVDQGYTVNQRLLPKTRIEGHPVEDAPFFLEPAEVHKQLDFNDPQMDGLLDYESVGGFEGFISIQDQLFIRQIEGALQIAVAPEQTPNTNHSITIQHLFVPSDLDYLGVRFYLDAYQGWSSADMPIRFHLMMVGLQTDLYLGTVNQSQQHYSSPNGQQFSLDLGWHTLEYVQESSSADCLDVYLDGTAIGRTEAFTQDDQYAGLNFYYEMSSNSDWALFTIDEILFGGEKPLYTASVPEQAGFRFLPDEVVFQETFEQGLPSGLSLGSDVQLNTSGNMLNFSFSPQDESEPLLINWPAPPLPEWNYFGARYRLEPNQNEHWSDWGYLNFSFVNNSFQHPDGYSPIIEASRFDAIYFYGAAQNSWEGLYGSPENFGAGEWHTMEMLIRPLSSAGEDLVLEYWQDRVLIGSGILEEVEKFRDPQEEYHLEFQVYPGNHRSKLFSGQIEKIVIGTLEIPANEE